MLNDVDPMGLYDLRVEIAKHIDIYRGIEIDPKQILIGSSSNQLLSIVIELLGRSQRYAIEDPAYPKIYHVLNTLDITVDMIDVDHNGLIVSELKKTNVNVVHVVPSHQYPLGVTMSIQRKKELLNWAYEKKGRYIIEDDYDSEFKYQGKPIEALKGLDALDKVIYMNTFSKSLAPSFRVAYVVLPKPLLNDFTKISMYHRCTVPSFEQYILYKFMHTGSFTRHLHRMMKIYKQKLDIILNILKGENDFMISGYESGLHFILSFKSKMSEDMIIDKLKINNINVSGVKSYKNIPHIKSDEVNLVVGYAGISMSELETGFKRLLNVCKQYVKL
jgi:GntR family transcriptional regulator/MocR family aminotransferase